MLIKKSQFCLVYVQLIEQQLSFILLIFMSKMYVHL